MLGEAFWQTLGWIALTTLALPLLCLAMPKLTRPASRLATLLQAGVVAIGELVKWSLPALVLVTAFSVFALSVFGLAWTKVFESATYFHAVGILLGAGATLAADQHVRVDIFHSRMSYGQKATVDILGFYALLVPLTVLILWTSQGFVGTAWANREGSADADGIQLLYGLKAALPVFAVLLLAQGLATALRAAASLTQIHEPG